MRSSERAPVEPLQYYELRDERDKSVGVIKVFFLMLVAFALGMGMMHIVQGPVTPSNEVEVGFQQPNLPLEEVKIGIPEPSIPLNEVKTGVQKAKEVEVVPVVEAEVGQCVDDETKFHASSSLTDCAEAYVISDGNCEIADPDGVKLKDVCCKTCADGIGGMCQDFDRLIAEFSVEEGVTCEILVGRHGCDFYSKGDASIDLKDLCCQTCTSGIETKIGATGKELELYSDEVRVGIFGWLLSKAASWFYQGRTGGSKAAKQRKYNPSKLTAYATLRDGQMSCGGGLPFNWQGSCNARKAIKGILHDMALPRFLQNCVNAYARNIPNQWNKAFCLGNWKVENWDDDKQRGGLSTHGCTQVMVPGDWGDVSVAALKVPGYDADFCLVSNVCNWSRAFAFGVGPGATSYLTKYIPYVGWILSAGVNVAVSTGFSPNGLYRDEITFFNGDGWYVQKVNAHFYLKIHAQTTNLMKIFCKYTKGFKKFLGCNKKQSKRKRKQFFSIETEHLLMVEFPSGYANNAHNCLFGQWNACDPIDLITDPIFLMKAQGHITMKLNSLAWVMPKLQITAHTYLFKNSWGLFLGGDINAKSAIDNICNNIANIIGLSCPAMAVAFELWVTSTNLGFQFELLGHTASCKLIYSPFSFQCGVSGSFIAWSFNYNYHGRRRLAANPHAEPIASDFDLQDPEGFDVVEVVREGELTGIVRSHGKNTPLRVGEPMVKGRPAKEAKLEEAVKDMDVECKKRMEHILESKDLMLKAEPTDQELEDLKQYYPETYVSEDDDEEDDDEDVEDDVVEDDDTAPDPELKHLPSDPTDLW